MLQKTDSGVFIPIITPFTIQDEVDLNSFENQLDLILSAPVKGIVVCGTTGEGLYLSEDEKKTLIQTVVDYRTRSYPFKIIVATGTQKLDEAVSIATFAEEVGCDAALAYPPRTESQDEIILFYHSLAQATTLPILGYNIPRITGSSITPETYQKMVNKKSVIGIKDSSRDEKLLFEWKKVAPDSLVIVGEDTFISLGIEKAGATATIAGSGNLYPHDIDTLFQESQKGNGSTLQLELNEKVKKLLETGSFIGGLKAALKKKGMLVDDGRRVP
ncbi:MAG: dihydrodipicolinate synthase family protein [archaeon]